MSDNLESEITCRLSLPQDLDFIYSSLKKVAEEDGYISHFFLTRNDLREALFSKTAHSECIIGEHQNKPIALVLFTLMHLNFNRYQNPGIYVHDLYVQKDFRRKGVARALGNTLKDIAIERGCDRIDGIVPKTNQNATAFYQTIEEIKVLDYIHYMRLNLRGLH